MSKTWIVFSGGNGRGAYQSGALEAFQLRGITFDGAAGISVGAINAAAVSYDLVQDVTMKWRSVREHEFIQRGKIARFIFRLGVGRLGFKKTTGLHNTEPLKWLIDEMFGPFRRKKPLFAGRVDIVRGTYVDTVQSSKGAVEEIWRSTLIPAVMQADRFGPALWVDGGVHNITPLNRIVQEAGDGDTVWIVLTKNRKSNPPTIDKSVAKIDAIDILKTSIDHLIDRQFHLDLRSFLDRNKIPGYKKFNVHIIEPSKGLGAGDDYSREKLNFRIDLGRSDTLAYIDQKLR